MPFSFRVNFYGLLLASLIANNSAHAQKPIELYAVDYPPYEIENPVDGLEGFDVEVIKEAFDLAKQTVSITYLPWKRAMEMVKHGYGLGALTCRKHESRDQFVIYSDPISQASNTIMVNQHYTGEPIKNLDDLKGLDVISVRGYASAKMLTDHGITYRLSNSMRQGIEMLFHRNYDAFFVTKENAQYLAPRLGHHHDFKYFDLIDQKTSPFHICFSKSWPNVEEIVHQFNQALSKLKASGRYQIIHSKYGRK